MKVRVFKRAKRLLRLSGAGAAVMLMASVSSAQTPGWLVRLLDTSGTIDSHTIAEQQLSSATFPVEADVSKIYPVVDLAGGGGNFSPNFNYPNLTSGTGMSDFAVRASADVVIPAGTWTIGFGSDDGGQVTVQGVTMTSTFGENGPIGVAGQARFEGNRGHAWTGGTFTVTEPTSTKVIASMHERGGGDSFEVAIAQGTQGGYFAGNTWKLLGNGTMGWEVMADGAADPIPAPVINIAGTNAVGSFNAASPVFDVAWGAFPNATQEGLTHRWYNFNNPGNYTAVYNRVLQGNPTVGPFRNTSCFSHLWYGDGDAEGSLNASQYPQQILDNIASFAGSATNIEQYMAIMTGEIKIEKSGVYKFKDGIDDFTSLKIDLNDDGIFQGNEHLINDNNWTGFGGTQNGGSPIVQRDITAPADGWLNIEFIMNEGGGGDAGVLYWDYDTFTQTVGGGAALGFPTANGEAFGAAVGAAQGLAQDDTMVPNNYLRTGGVKPITGGNVSGSLVPGGTYRFELGSTDYSDRIVVDGQGVFTADLDVTGTTFEIVDISDLADNDTVQIVRAGNIVGTPTFVFPGGTTFDTSNFAATGEITLTSGGRSLGGGYNPDSDNDGDVDSVDLGAFIGSWTGSLDAGNVEGSAERPDLVYNAATGEVTLVPAAGGKLVGFTLGNAAGEIKPVSDLNAVLPWQVVLGDNTTKQLGSSDLTFVGTDAPIELGAIFPAGIQSASALAEWLSLANATTALGAAGRSTFDLVVVPEPGSLALLSLGLLGAVNCLRRRRR